MQATSNDFHMMAARELQARAQYDAVKQKSSAYRRMIGHSEFSESATILRKQVIAQNRWRLANQRLSSRAVAEDRARRKKGARKL